MTENPRGHGTETKYGRVPLWLYETGVGLQAIAAYGWLHGRYGHYERIMPSYATLAKELGVSRGSVIAYVKALTSVGAVRIETSGAAGRQTNRYAIAFDGPFPVAGQNADHPTGQNADPVVSGVHHPSQPADGGGQPVVQEEDFSTKTFLEEDEKISLPAVPPPRAEVVPVSDEREMLASFEDSHPADPIPGVDAYAAQLADADPVARVTDSWVEAYKRSSGGSEPSAKAASRVRASVASRIRAGKTADDLVLIAADMAETNLTWTDLAEHEAHWLHKQQQGLTGTDATVKGWLDLADQLSGQSGGRQRHQPYRDDVWHRLDEQARLGQRPDGWERVPFCGHLDCDEITRMRQIEDSNGLKSLTYCSACHPALQF